MDEIWAGLKDRRPPNGLVDSLQLASIGGERLPEVQSFFPTQPPACLPSGMSELWRRYSAGDSTLVSADQIYRDVARILTDAGRVPPKRTITEQYTTGWSNKTKSRTRTVKAWKIPVGSVSSGYDSYTIYGSLYPDGRHDGRSDFGPSELPAVAALTLSLLGPGA